VVDLFESALQTEFDDGTVMTLVDILVHVLDCLDGADDLELI